MYDCRKYYVVYHNEVRYVDPCEYPDKKVRFPLPPKCHPRQIFVTTPGKLEYQDVACRARYAVRRIRCIAFMDYPGNIAQIIELREGIERRRRLHDAEREMKEADAMLADAINARLNFKKKLEDGAYDDGRIRTEMAIRRNEATSRALAAAREREARAARELYMQLAAYGTITWEEANRRIGVAMTWGSSAE